MEKQHSLKPRQRGTYRNLDKIIKVEKEEEEEEEKSRQRNYKI